MFVLYLYCLARPEALAAIAVHAREWTTSAGRWRKRG